MRVLYPEPMTVTDVGELGRPDRPGSRTEWLSVNMIVSLDGSATVAGRSGGLGSTADRQLFVALRSHVDAVLVGAGTVRAERYGPPADDGPTIAVVSVTGDLGEAPLSRAEPFADGRPRVVVVGPTAARPLPTEWGAGVVWSGAAPGTDPAVAAVEELRRRGLANVLCEGGPTLLTSLTEAGLVDEWNVSIAAAVAPSSGREARLLGAASRVMPLMPLRLVRICEADGMVFLRYHRP